MILHLLVLVPATPSFGQMQVGGISIAADNSEFDNENNTLTLIGNVQLIYNGYYLSSDKAVLNRESKEVVAESRVVLQTIDTYIEADKAEFNLDTQRGVFYKGFIQSGKVIFEGDIIKKIADKKYEATNASYTACNTCPPAWSFSGSLIKAELGGYADISLPVLKVANIPIFILPKILVPLKSERQSGVLVPSMKFGGSNGITIINRYFWAISRSEDLTLSAYKYETRGWKAHGHYRYILNENSQGDLKGAYLYDQAFKNCVQDCKNVNPDDVLEQKVDRGFVGYSHYYLLPHNIVQRAAVYWISDLRYIRDFSDELDGLHGRSAIENRLSVTKNSEMQHLSGELAFYTNLLKENAFAGNEESVHRLPDIKYSLIERRVGNSNLLFRMDIDYTNFNRNNFSYDDICSDDSGLNLPCADLVADDDPNAIRTRFNSQRDGKFDPGIDLIRTGQRLDISPQISYPIPIGNVLNIMPSIKFRETQYRFNSLSDDVSQTAARRYVETNVSMRTLLSQLYGDVNNPNANSYKHEIEPEILFSQRPWVRRPEHIFFGDYNSQPYSRSTEKLSDVDLFGNDNNLYGLNKVQFDYEDRLFNKKLLTFKLTNNFIRKIWQEGTPSYRSIVNFAILQSYDFDQLERDNPKPWSNVDLLFRVNLDNLVIYSTASYYPYANATNNSTRIRLITEDSSFLETAYTQTFTVDDDNTYRFAERSETITGSAGFNFKYLILKGTLNYNSVSRELQSWKYESIIKPPGECWNLEFSQWGTIGTEKPEYEINFNFDFSGKTI
ncbi:MAG: LPS-assembly protein LptD [Bdellovibrionales bacterium]|nr:LPS-assembly protein LptD [Bdellovibrionales bacterium]